MMLANGQRSADTPGSIIQAGRGIVWVRHALTRWNHEGRLQGRIDIDVDDNAVVDTMYRITPQLDGLYLVWSSPLLRAHRSAAFMADALGLALQIDDCLTELAFGPFEGRRLKNLAEKDRTRLLEWMRQPFATTPPWDLPWPNPEEAMRIFLERLDIPVAVVGHTVNSRWLEHLCGHLGVRFTRVTVASIAADVSCLL